MRKSRCWVPALALVLLGWTLGAADLPEGLVASEGARWSFAAGEVPRLEVLRGTVTLVEPTTLTVRTTRGPFLLERARGVIRRGGFLLETGRAYFILPDGSRIPLRPAETPDTPFSRYLTPLANIFSASGALGSIQLEFE